MNRSWASLAACLAAGLLSATAALGADNLVFVSLPPCRVIDTRIPGAGGRIVAGTTRTFVLRGPTLNYQNPVPFPNQGGSTTGCGIPDLSSFLSAYQNAAKAVAINIVAVGASGAGDLRAWAANAAPPNASVVNYAAVAGLNIANGVIVPMCDQVSATPCASGDITFQADVSSTHLVVDVVGYFSASSPSSISNTALGHRALEANTTGSENTALGYGALHVNQGGRSNTALGSNSLGLNSSGYGNTAVGRATMYSNSTGTYNAAIGDAALSSNQTGYLNTALGHQALVFNLAGHANTATGALALASNQGNFNTADGFEALQSNTTGFGNTAIGYMALRSATGSMNIAIGPAAGQFVTTGSGNIEIGNGGTSSDSSVIRLGGSQSRAFIAGVRDVTTGNNDAVNVVIDSAGQLGTVSSSIRFKEDVHDLGSAADRVLELRPVSFRYKKPFVNGEKPVQYGLIAEEVEKVFPELVAYSKDGMPETVKYQVLPTLLLAELERESRELVGLRREKDEEIARLGAQVKALLARVELLERERPASSQPPSR